MCGICGVAAADPRRPIDPAMVRRMTSTLWHRGPDGEGEHTAEGVGLGMRRLSIVDLANAGDQLLGVLGVQLWHAMFAGSELRAPESRASRTHVRETLQSVEAQ